MAWLAPVLLVPALMAQGNHAATDLRGKLVGLRFVPSFGGHRFSVADAKGSWLQSKRAHGHHRWAARQGNGNDGHAGADRNQAAAALEVAHLAVPAEATFAAHRQLGALRHALRHGLEHGLGGATIVWADIDVPETVLAAPSVRPDERPTGALPPLRATHANGPAPVTASAGAATRYVYTGVEGLSPALATPRSPFSAPAWIKRAGKFGSHTVSLPEAPRVMALPNRADGFSAEPTALNWPLVGTWQR